jgi:putative endonuclease
MLLIEILNRKVIYKLHTFRKYVCLSIEGFSCEKKYSEWDGAVNTPLRQVLSYFVYVLKSESTGQFYIGHTNNITRRLSQHNNSEYRGTKHTKRNKRPWVSVYNEKFNTRAEAIQMQKVWLLGRDSNPRPSG